MQKKVNKLQTKVYFYQHLLCQSTALRLHSSVKTGNLSAELVLPRSLLGTWLCDYNSDTVHRKQKCLCTKGGSVICPAGMANIPHTK